MRDDGKGYKERTVCDDCAKPQPFKTKECVKCGKTFKVKHLKKIIIIFNTNYCKGTDNRKLMLEHN